MRALARPGGSGTGSAGVTCAVLQDGNVYLAQAGTTRAYILGPMVCRRVAPSSPWDPIHVDVREEPLAQPSVLILAPSVLEDALPLLQGGLPPVEVQRLIKAWLQDRPQLSALVVGTEGGREVALAAGVHAAGQEEQRPAPQPAAKARPLAVKSSAGPQVDPREGSSAEAPFPILRALRLPLLLVAVLLAILVLGGLGWYLPGRQKGEDETKLVELLQKGDRARQLASLSSDPTQVRGILAQAEGFAKDAAAIRDKDKRVMALQQEIRDALDRVNIVVRPGVVTMLADLGKDGGSQSSPSRIVLDGNNLYVMDRGAGRVYKLLLDQGGQSLLKTPNNVLARKGDNHAGNPLGDLWDVIWVPSGPLRASASLLVLDAQGALLDYRPDRGIQVLPLRGVRGWASFKGARGYSGNLYVLDPAGKQIWRYVPTSSGYDSEARGILEDANIADAVDLAIDGNVYVLGSRGALWKFAGDVPKSIAQDGMDQPLSSPSALFTTPSTGYLYVADRGNGRVVAFDKADRFRFQVRADAMEGIQGLAVDESQGRLYFTSGQKVFAATVAIPPNPKP